MRLRTAHVKITKEAGLNEVFRIAERRGYALITGEGHLYTALNTEARRRGYEACALASEDDEFEGVWAAVRADLISGTTGLDSERRRLVVETTFEGLGDITPLGEEAFVDPERLTVISHLDKREFLNYEIAETLYRVEPLES